MTERPRKVGVKGELTSIEQDRRAYQERLQRGLGSADRAKR